MYASKRRTLRSTTMTMFSHMTKSFCFCQMWHDIYIGFFLKLPQFHTFNYRNIVWQHTEGVVGSIIWVLLEIYLAFQQWQNCKSPFRIDKVIAISLVYYFFGTQCTQTLILKVKVICLSFSSWNLLNSVCSHWANLLAIRTVSNAYSGKQCSF